ncbi:hypothetical protein Aduo_005230 [Ancylostoma duodenale]
MNLLLLLPIIAVEGLLIVDPEFSTDDGGVSRWTQQRWYLRNEFDYDQLRIVSAGSRERKLGFASWQFRPGRNLHFGELSHRWPRPNSARGPSRLNVYHEGNRLRRQWHSRRVSGDVHAGRGLARQPAENSLFEGYEVTEEPQALLRSIQRTTMATPIVWNEQTIHSRRFRREGRPSQANRR